MYDLILISTCINKKNVNNLIYSIQNNNIYLNAFLIIVNQDQSKIKNLESNFTDLVILNKKPKEKLFFNSSEARNIAIEYILNNSLISKYVCFPDDDTTFDNNFFLELSHNINNNIFDNFIFDVYCANSNHLFHSIKYAEGKLISRSDFKFVGAVNILVNYDTFLNTGFFDNRFGVNALYGAGEDGDYFLRSLKYQKFYYTKKLYNYHPSQNNTYSHLTYKETNERLKNYGKGVIILLIKHKMYLHSFILIFKALGGSIYYLFKKMPITSLAYLNAFFVRLYTFLFFTFKKI
jgi:hypothetical protein